MFSGLFGEGPAERRDRLRNLVAEVGMLNESNGIRLQSSLP